jgi:uncharacterized protein YjbI with pentapeptide repeats
MMAGEKLTSRAPGQEGHARAGTGRSSFRRCAHATPGKPGGGRDYDTVHFDRLSFTDADASGSRFLECALTHASFPAGQLRRARFTGAWLRDVRWIATGLAETSWVDITIIGGAVAGAEAFGAQLRRVVMRGCKLDSVNLRGADLAEVTFESCVLQDVDFTGAALTKTAFPGSTLVRTTLTRVTIDQVDLRGAEAPMAGRKPAAASTSSAGDPSSGSGTAPICRSTNRLARSPGTAVEPIWSYVQRPSARPRSVSPL